MLRTLRISNYALIEDLTLPFEPGLNVLTGETGAGKTILLEALGLLLGRRAETGALRPGAALARVEGIWEAGADSSAARVLESAGLKIEDGEFSIRREISADGKSRAYVNGSPVTLSFLKELGESLLRVHGQAAAQDLRASQSWMDLLDRHAGAWAPREEIQRIQARLRGLEAELEELGGDPQERAKKTEYLRFQAEEIERAALEPGEEEAVVSALKMQQNAQRILGHLAAAESLLEAEAAEGGALSSLARAVTELRASSALGTPTSALAEELESLESAGREVLKKAARIREGLVSDPEELRRLSERLDLIRSLQRKYGPGIEEILANGKKFREELARLEGGEERLASVGREKAALLKSLAKEAKALRGLRREASGRVETELRKELDALHLRNAALNLAWTSLTAGAVEAEPGLFVGSRGPDDLAILFSANPGMPALPLGQVASGGELSRVCLALLALLGSEAGLGSYVFDEIDAGVGGEAVWALGRRLAKLAGSAQVLIVTHQPAVARFGSHHLRVAKENRKGSTVLSARPVEGEERLQELARMMGGKELGEAALRHAKDLFERK